MSLVAICVFFGEMSVLVLPIFLTGLFDFLLLSYMSYLYILEIKSLSVISFVSIFSCLQVVFLFCYGQRMFFLCSLLGVLWCHVLYLSLSHFEFIFVHGVTVCTDFTDLHTAV